jgi:glyoxylase-like metal-dependent hydrolase (beta-lactamase superfamily II)
MEVAELAPGLWRWTARHPEWTSADEDEWDPDIGCVYAEIDGRIVTIDPLVPSEPADRDRFWLALDRDVERLGPPVVLTTTVDHVRSAAAVVERYGVAGRAPVGVKAFLTALRGEIIYWLEPFVALVPGDVLLGDDAGGVRVCPDDWLEGADHDAVRASLQPLLELPVERILVSHGTPVLSRGHDALARALRA